MDFDNPGDDHSDFTDSEKSSKEKREKILLGSSKKKDKEKKEKKEKETRYNQLGAESSNDEEDVKGSGKSKKKAFKIGLAKKDKKEKKEKEKEIKDKDVVDAKEVKEAKKKEKKEKSKLKLKKSNKESDSTSDKNVSKTAEVSFPPIFGVDLELAVERNRCHDGVMLPVIVRECVDYIEAEGLTVEGIYRSSGVKSKIAKLKTAYNSRTAVKLSCYEPAVVASLFKMFLRELPEPVLTNKLNPKFEEVSQMKIYTERRDGLVRLMGELPECNRVLIQWVFVHMSHVIANVKMNKMTLQNVSIVLSPTMRISHRVLNCIFEHHAALFSSVKLPRYIPPISGPLDLSKLPETPAAIELEMRKQESLLSELHTEVSSGVMMREDQLWEQQRIVTQLKRSLRHAKSAKTVSHSSGQEQDYEEELNFALQTVTVADKEKEKAAPWPGGKETVAGVESPGEETKEHKVTVQVHRDQELTRAATMTSDRADSKVTPSEHVTVITLNQQQQQQHPPAPAAPTPIVPLKPAPTPPSKTTTMPPSVTTTCSVTPASKPAAAVVSTPASAPGALTSAAKQFSDLSDGVKPIRDQSESSKPIRDETDSCQPIRERGVNQAEALEMTQTSPNSTQHFASQVVSFSSPIMSTKVIAGQQGGVSVKEKIPLLPPPPPSHKPKATNRSTARAPGTAAAELLPPENKLKSKSLPRGLPSDGTAFDSIEGETYLETGKVEEDSKERLQQREAMMLEEMRLKFEYEELMTLKSELERKKRTERREIAELQEEIATMQTLYQYRTYSVDSSEEDSEGAEVGDINNTKEVRMEKLKLLNSLAKEKRDLEDKKVKLQTRLAEERAACLRLRVNIRMEQERIKRQKLSQFPGIGFGKLNLMDD